MGERESEGEAVWERLIVALADTLTVAEGEGDCETHRDTDVDAVDDCVALAAALLLRVRVTLAVRDGEAVGDAAWLGLCETSALREADGDPEPYVDADLECVEDGVTLGLQLPVKLASADRDAECD